MRDSEGLADTIGKSELSVAQLFSLEGRTALITGGSRGIGMMIAAGFIAAGAKVYISSRKADACDAVASALGPMCKSLPADVSTVAGCRDLASAFASHEKELHILVNNAGATWGSPLETFPETGWDKVMDLNVKSPFFLVQALHPMLKLAAHNERPSKIINIASVDGQRPSHWETYSYQASKAAVLHLTRRLAARLVNDRIHVSAISPGAFPSDMNPEARDDGERMASHIPVGRIGNVQDIAAAAIYLASRAGDYVVGENLSVDGGLVHAVAAATRHG